MSLRNKLALLGLGATAAFASLLPGGPLTQQGTQPGLSNALLAPGNCASCHANYDAVTNIEPWNSWAGSMMSQASRDPLFWAALDVANHDYPGAGDFCLRCHVPAGWLAGRSEPPGGTNDGCGLLGKIDEAGGSDFQGVTCHLCHRLHENPSPPVGQDSLYFENGQYWVDDIDCAGSTQPCRRGPYDYPADGNPPPGGTSSHPWVYSAYHESSSLCGNCHNVTSPVKNLIVNGIDSGVRFPVERTHREWEQSAFATAGTTCQNCHMPDATASPSHACQQLTNDHMGDMPIHRFAGGNAWIPDVLRQEYPNLGLHDEFLATRNAALDMLQNQSAMLELTTPSQVYAGGGDLDIRVKVTNLTGHKLPTGYPEGRRMWINVQVRDAQSNLIWESGAYDPVTADLTVHETAKIYQMEAGIWNHNGSDLCDITDGSGNPMFHFVLNDCIVSDNRIPPLGFTGMNNPETQPVNYTYPETFPGSTILVNYDVTDYAIPVPPGTTSPVTVTATLRYQTSSKEYIEFLLDQSIEHAFPDDCIERTSGYPTSSRGELLHTMWSNYGKSAPVDMASDSGTVEVLDASPGEASGGSNEMLVTRFEQATGEIDIAYDPACAASDHTIYIGDLASVSTLAYSTRACAIGDSGTATFTTGGGSYFWLIVGHDGAKEGSYGTDNAGVERPEDTGPSSCALGQDLPRRCDF